MHTIARPPGWFKDKMRLKKPKEKAAAAAAAPVAAVGEEEDDAVSVPGAEHLARPTARRDSERANASDAATRIARTPLNCERSSPLSCASAHRL